MKAPFYYLRDSSPYALSKCRGKIVMIDGYLGYWVYHDLLEQIKEAFDAQRISIPYPQMEVTVRKS